MEKFKNIFNTYVFPFFCAILTSIPAILSYLKEDLLRLGIIGSILVSITFIVIAIHFTFIVKKWLVPIGVFVIAVSLVFPVLMLRQMLIEAKEVNQKFVDGVTVSVEAGNGFQDTKNLNVGESIPVRSLRFTSIGSVSTDKNLLYAVDNSILCAVDGQEAKKLISSYEDIGSEARIVHARDGDVYFLTELWEEYRDSGEFGAYTVLLRSFARIKDDDCTLLGAEPFEIGYVDLRTRNYEEKTFILDFAVSSNHNIWFLEQYRDIADDDFVTLERLPYDADTDSYGYQETWFQIPEVTCADMADAQIAFDNWDNLYISVPSRGKILVVPSEVIQSDDYQADCFPFAGWEKQEDNTPKYIDGNDPSFYHPTALACCENYIYVWDLCTIRRITIEGAAERIPSCIDCKTFAGIFHDDSEKTGPASGKGEAVKFATSYEAYLTVSDDGNVYLSDPTNNLIYLISAPKSIH